jgi:23S rRNA (guanosine2251-2'-O)-methyltransferase
MPKREWKPDWKRRTAGKPERGARPQRASQRTSGQHAGDPDGPVILYGWHPVKAALENPARGIRRLLATENALRRLTQDHVPLRVEPELVRPQTIAQRLSPDALHQGLLVEADPLPAPALEHIRPSPTDHRKRLITGAPQAVLSALIGSRKFGRSGNRKNPTAPVLPRSTTVRYHA